MSIARCAKCSRLIDTDDDPDCWRNTSPEDTEPFCELCRDKMDADQESEMLAAKRDYDAASPEQRDPERYRREMREAGRGHLLQPEE